MLDTVRENILAAIEQERRKVGKLLERYAVEGKELLVQHSDGISTGLARAAQIVKEAETGGSIPQQTRVLGRLCASEGRPMRLDEKPHPGPTITLGDLAQAHLERRGGLVEARLATGGVALPADLPLGRDFTCPDWRERLGRAMVRMRGFSDKMPTGCDGTENCGAPNCHEADLAILREEFGLEAAEAYLARFTPWDPDSPEETLSP